MSPSARGLLQDHICIHSNELQLNGAFYSINKRPIYHPLPTRKALCDRDRNKTPTISRWNIMTCSHLLRSWSSVSLHDCDSFFRKAVWNLLLSAGRYGSFPSLPCRETESAIWPADVTRLHHSVALCTVTPNHLSSVGEYSVMAV